MGSASGTLALMDNAEAMERLQAGGDNSIWHNTAILGYMEDDGALAEGYFAAADHVVTAWKAGDRNDMLAIPILMLYRHGIELALKHAIRETADRLQLDGTNDPQLSLGNLNEWLAKTHDIDKLVQRLTMYWARLRLGGVDQKLPADTLEVLNSLHALDATGQTFRYSTVKTRSGQSVTLTPARPDQQPVDIVTIASTLADAGSLILHGLTQVLDEYEDWQRDMSEEARAWGAEL